MSKLFILFLIVSLPVVAPAAFTIKDGKLVNKDNLATDSIQEHYGRMLAASDAEEWDETAKHARIIIKNFPSTNFSREAQYFLGLASFKTNQFARANSEFTNYLIGQAAPKYFEEAIHYKFEIAEKFLHKRKLHLIELSDWSDAIAIYDEVIAALPHRDLAAQALYGKARAQTKNLDYTAAIETYQTLIRRFPKHPLAVESFIGIGLVYFKESREVYPDQDYLDLAALNLKKFREAFPAEEKFGVAQQFYVEMQEHYANYLFETARFYERTKKWGAAKMYYAKILKTYPDSQLAKKSKERHGILEERIALYELKKSKK